MDQSHEKAELEPVLFEPIAVIGYAFKYPQEATDTNGLWNILMEKKCTSTDIPRDRMNVDAFYHSDSKRHDAFNFRGGHFLKSDLGAFDASFFSIKPKEAEAMDPHQRLLLETTYHALENAGLRMEDLSGTLSSVFTASFCDGYRSLMHRDPDRIPTYHVLGTFQSLLANRISWFFNLKGASLNVDTACSSSLVAIDQACQNLRNHESSMCIVTGGNLILDPANLVAHSNLNLLSPDSRCFSFDHRANGYSPGEGVGVVILQRLSDAIRDGNCIRAVLRSSGTNSDGRTPGISQPSAAAQEALIRSTYEKSGLSMRHTRMFEAHGTGTAIGDPTEASAIATAFRNACDAPDCILIGALKSNIGHLEGGSGIASLIKTIMVLERGIIPPNANFERLNPKIDKSIQQLLKFPLTAHPWPSSGLRRASVNSFGLGGTNSHIVLEDACNHLRLRGLQGIHQSFPDGTLSPSANGDLLTATVVNGSKNDTKTDPSWFPRLLIWSAADEHSLRRLTELFQTYVAGDMAKLSQDHMFLDDLAYTLSSRRSVLKWRTFTIVRDNSLLKNVQNQSFQPVHSTDHSALSYIFTGQGAQWPRMGVDLMILPVFRNSLEEASRYFQRLGSTWSLFGKYYELEAEANSTRIHTAAVSQPLCTALQIALVDTLWDFGVKPSAVVGHSSGEIAASYCCGAISREDAWRIAYYRGFLSEKLSKSRQGRGAMMAIGQSAAQVQPWFSAVGLKFGKCNITVACFNSPKNITVSGEEAHIDYLATLLSETPTFHRKLKVDMAYHSSAMEGIVSEYQTLLGNLNQRDSRTPEGPGPVMISTLTGDVVPKAALRRAQYWIDNTTSPVRFEDAVLRLSMELRNRGIGNGHDCSNHLLEIGPHPALQGPVREIMDNAAPGLNFKYSTCLKRSCDSTSILFETLGTLYCHGLSVDLEKVNSSFRLPRKPKVLVDLPAYPFNHSQSYWHEGVADRGYRLRPFSRNDLLGIPVPDFNPEDARWRHCITISDLPWVKDHVVNGTILYPAAGMIVMAVEASKLLAGPDKLVKAFEIRNMQFETSLTIPLESGGVETSFSLRRVRARQSNSSSWSEFVLSHYHRGKWIENSRGLISVEYDEQSPGFGHDEERHQYHESYQSAKTECVHAINTRYFYSRLKEFGLEYGPSFQCLRNASFSKKGMSVSEVQLFVDTDIAPNAAEGYTVHPTSLDAIFHLLYANLSGGAEVPIPTMVPSQLRRLWISNEGLRSPNARSVQAIATTARLSSRIAQSTITALDSATHDPLVLVEGIEVVAVAGLDNSGVQQKRPHQAYHQMTWKADVTLMDREQFSQWVGSGIPDRPEQGKFFEQLTLFLLISISSSLTWLNEHPQNASQEHHQKYVSWMKRIMGIFRRGNLPGAKLEWVDVLNDGTYMDKLSRSISAFSEQGKFFSEVASNVRNVLSGEKSIQEVLFANDLAANMYRESYRTPNLDHGLMKLLDALSHKYPNMRILEVGAGTGAGTRFVTDILSNHGTQALRCSRYDFTDISPYFFDRARDQFSTFGDRLHFKIFDIEKDPSAQNIEKEYDLVVAFSSIHVTKNMSQTLRNMRSVLRPGGKLLICDPTRPEILRTAFATGLLADWWLGQEDHREWTPVISKSKWRELLCETGFSGTDLIIDDYHDVACQENSIMITTAVDPSIKLQIPEVVILTDPGSSRTDRLVETLKSTLEPVLKPEGREEISVTSLAQLRCEPAPVDRVYVCLLEYDQPMLHNLDEEKFSILQSHFLTSRSILWVTGGGHPGESPMYGVIDGLFRVLRSENIGTDFCTLALESQQSDFSRHAKHICKILEEMFLGQTDVKTVEFAERAGVLWVNRLEKLETLDKKIWDQSDPNVVLDRVIEKHPPFKLEIKRPGLLDSLQFVEQNPSSSPLLPEEVEVRTEAVGMTLLDVMASMGRTKTGHLGAECSGVVTRAGPHSGLQSGDRVAFIANHGFCSITRSSAAVKIPNLFSFEEAAAIPLAFTVAYHALVEIARAQPGETVLIHGGACATGNACIQIAQLLKLDIFVTTEAVPLVLENFDLPEQRVLPIGAKSFVKPFSRMTRGKGIDIVLNTLDEDGSLATWDLISPFGRFIELKPVPKSDEWRLRLPEDSNVMYHTLNVFELASKRPQKAKQHLENIMRLFRSSSLKLPAPFVTYSASSVGEAFRNFKDLGKTVVTLKGDDLVKVTMKTKPPLFEENATYVVSGGLGWCGRVIVRWMVNRGAKHLVLLSRTGPASASDFIASLRSDGATIATPACDIGSLEELQTTLEQVQSAMPPIKGCIQCAAVFEDRIFAKMTYEEWRNVTNPKIRGTWNLHAALPSGLSFFIMLSSMSACIGFPSQAHYAAGNTFQDRLAQYRRSQNERAVALDLGPIAIEGQEEYRTEAFLDLVYRSGFHLPQSADDLCALLEYVITQEEKGTTSSETETSQLVMGIRDPAEINSLGKQEPIWMKSSALFSHFYARQPTTPQNPTDKNSGLPETSQKSIPELLAAASTITEASSIVTKCLTLELATILSLKAADIDARRPMNSYGVDSLVAIDIRTWFQTKAGADISVFDLLANATIEDIATMAARRSRFVVSK